MGLLLCHMLWQWPQTANKMGNLLGDVGLMCNTCKRQLRMACPVQTSCSLLQHTANS